MYDVIIENLNAIIPVGLLVAGTLWGILKYHKNKVTKAFKEGKAEEACLTKIENKADEAVKEVKKVKDQLVNAKEEGDEHHKKLYEKLDKHADILAKMHGDLSYVRGKLENT